MPQDLLDLVRRQEKVCSRKNTLAYFILKPLLKISLSLLENSVIKNVILIVSFYGVLACQVVNFCMKDIVKFFYFWFVVCLLWFY